MVGILTATAVVLDETVTRHEPYYRLLRGGRVEKKTRDTDDRLVLVCKFKDLGAVNKLRNKMGRATSITLPWASELTELTLLFSHRSAGHYSRSVVTT